MPLSVDARALRDARRGVRRTMHLHRASLRRARRTGDPADAGEVDRLRQELVTELDDATLVLRRAEQTGLNTYELSAAITEAAAKVNEPVVVEGEERVAQGEKWMTLEE